MLTKVGDAVINTEDVLFAKVNDAGQIDVRFRNDALLRVETQDADGDLARLERATTRA